MKQRLEEAYRFLHSNPSNPSDEPGYEGSNPNPSPAPAGGQRLAADVEKTLQNAGMKEETFNKLAGKYGDAMVALGFGSQK